ncbi:hypothetical protein ACIBJE_12085 [Micromonospora sp. NPDC050187]|uniref:hypothetical protein n=1 Tax=Micromonospora sp. NPDC050187 TaxID=3364277 RepID=UPI0037A573C9
MTVRRRAARLAVVCALLGGVVAVGATPALADDDSVRARVSSSFTAGGSAGSVSVEVRKRSGGCVLLRTGLRLRLEGVRADQVEVHVSAGGQWWPVPVSGGGLLVTERTSPVNPTLCKGKSITVRYRVAFLPGAPAGKLTVAGEATTAGGQMIGRGADTSQVRAGRNATPSPKPTKSPTPSPTPSPVETGPPTEDPTAESTLAAVSGGGGRAADESGSGGGFSPVMVLGGALVAVGLGLIFLLFRRSRADRRDVGGSASTPLPGNPGGTTYRSGGQPGPATAAGAGYFGGPPTATGYPGGAAHLDDPTGYPVPPAGPTRGTVYPASPRGTEQPPSGTVYPASPRGTEQPPSGTVYPASPPGQWYGPAGPVYPAPRSGQPGTSPPPESTGGGDSTAIMPRLPE